MYLSEAGGESTLWNKHEGRTGRQHPTPWESPSWCDTRPSVGLFITESMWNCVCVYVCVCACIMNIVFCHGLSFWSSYFLVRPVLLLASIPFSRLFSCSLYLLPLFVLSFVASLLLPSFHTWLDFWILCLNLVRLPARPLVSRIWVPFCVNCTGTTQPTMDYLFMVHNLTIISSLLSTNQKPATLLPSSSSSLCPAPCHHCCPGPRRRTSWLLLSFGGRAPWQMPQLFLGWLTAHLSLGQSHTSWSWAFTWVGSAPLQSLSHRWGIRGWWGHPLVPLVSSVWVPFGIYHNRFSLWPQGLKKSDNSGWGPK